MTTLERAPVTVALAAACEEAGIPIGLLERPRLGGWTGDPSLSDFKPYGVLVPQTANSSVGPQSDSQADWHLPYTLTLVSVDAGAVELIADRVRVASQALVRTTVSATSGDTYRVIRVAMLSLGGIARLDQSDPPSYTQTDSLEVWVSKEIR